MMDVDGAQPLSAQERARRSVFVGNIPYEATEEALRDIFQQAGPVISFRLVYDRETGKPKGYGFCEYQDVETAHSALRNLNNTDFNGRPLRVGVAAGESNKDDMAGMQQALGGPVLESPYGESVDPEKAPEAISKAVASLPPEQMFELMKQMKLCIQNNPTEARNMLLQNPQLAYALLQAQIVMKIVDPQVAMAMLHRDASQIPPANSSASVPNPIQSAPISQAPGMPQQQPAGLRMPMGMPGGPRPNMGGGPMSGPGGPPGGMDMPRGIGSLLGSGPMGGPRPGMGGPGPAFPAGAMGGPPNQGPPRQDFRDPRMMQGGPGPMQGGPGPMQGGPGPMQGGPGPMQGGPGPMQGGPGPMQGGPRPGMPPSSMAPGLMPGQMPSNSLMQGLQGLSGGLPNTGPGVTSEDQEKAALIMQVLQLTDQQIAMLPADQRQSILILKEQLTKNA